MTKPAFDNTPVEMTRARASIRSARATARGRLFSLSPSEILRFVQRQKVSFMLVSLYLFIEYVRPQSVYPAIAFIPWGELGILLSLGAYLLQGGKIRFDGLTRLVLLYTAVILASTLTAFEPSAALDGYRLWFSWVLVYLIISNIVDTEQKYLVFMLMFLLWNMKMAQHGVRSWASDGFHFRRWGATGGPGWFENSGEFGIEMDVFMPLAICFILGVRPYLSRWKIILLASFPTAAILSMVASSSRGALIGGAAAALWLLARSRHRVRGGLAVAALAIAVYWVLPHEQLMRFQSAGTDATSTVRLTYWTHGLQIIGEYPALGVGYNNWLPYYHDHFNAHGQLPHNIFIQCGAELGVIGLLTLLALLVGSFVVNGRTRALAARIPDADFLRHMANGLDAALIGFLASGFFVTVLYYPYLWVNLALTAALYNSTRARMSELTRHARYAPITVGPRKPIVAHQRWALTREARHA